MNQAFFEITIIFLLLIANGVFAMAEIAVVSAKKARLRRLADQGNGKARIALELEAALFRWAHSDATKPRAWRRSFAK